MGALVGEDLVGFAYGYPWSWETETDDWSQQLRYRLGINPAALIQESFAVLLLAVHPGGGAFEPGQARPEGVLGLLGAVGIEHHQRAGFGVRINADDVAEHL